ncbi:MAG: DUF4230 domain-containing protein [Saprospiraceae bacterium]|nr:DUF4230 domain-containing protein [Saprospiraceae bacterium]
MTRKIIIGIGLTAVLIAGFWIGRSLYRQREADTAQVQSQVLLERIENVAKLITVEGYFSEIYDFKDYWRFDWAPFQRKALLRVKAKVSVGYDLSKMEVNARPEEKLIVISNLPDPEILSIDHDVDYYDINEGIFNSFTEADYTRMNRGAKKAIEEQALKSDLLLSAEKQAGDLLDLMRFMVESAGWRLEFERAPEKLKEKG